MTTRNSRSRSLDTAARDNAAEDTAWAMVCERETGKRFYSPYEIRQRTGIQPAKVKAMVARCRLIRRAEIELPATWWEARVVVKLPAEIIAQQSLDATEAQSAAAAITTTNT